MDHRPADPRRSRPVEGAGDGPQPRFRFRMVAKAFEPETHNWSEKIALEIDHKLLPGFDRVIAANAQLARQLCRLGCRIGQIDVIPDEQIEEAAPTAE